MIQDVFKDFRGQLSWGRFCSFAALVVAIVQEIRGAELSHCALWLGIATGSYTTSKITEMVTAKVTQVGQ